MTPLLLVTVLLVATRLPVATTCVAGAAALAIHRVPVLAIPLGAGWLTAGVGHRRRVAKEATEKAIRDVAALAELTAMALTGGLGLRRSLELAGAAVGGPVGNEVGAVLDQMRIEGSVVLTTVGGMAAPLYRALGRGASGAAL